MDRITGTVKRVLIDKGFGFARGSDGVEYFFHRAMVHGTKRFDQLEAGAPVEITVGETTPKGPRADAIRTL